MELNRFGNGSGVSRRGLLLGGAALAAGLTTLGAAPAAAAPARGRRAFVTRRGREFVLGGRPWRFSGTNCYYLHQKSPMMIDAVLEDAAAMGLRTVRAWAFADGTERSEKPLQPAPGVYDDAAFDSLDHAITRAGELGLRLVLPLTNNWPDYGGMAQYVQWFRGLSAADAQVPVNHDAFYTDPQIRACFEAWVRHLLGRTNRYTGVRYVDDPAIMTWELANEPRCQSDPSGRTLLAWADRTSKLVRRLAPRQLVAVGDEGFLGEAGNPDYPYSDYEGNNWSALTNLPAIDYGTLHLYPDAWKGGLSVPERAAWGTEYIRRHLTDRTVRKPVVLEEFGIEEQDIRAETYAAWQDAVHAGGGAGDNFWILTAEQDDGTLYPDYDGFRVTYPSELATQLAAHARRMAGR